MRKIILMNTIVLAAFGFFQFANAKQNAAVQISFALDSEQTLPGIPVGLRFSVANKSHSTLIIPNFVLLEVERNNGEVFLPRWGLRDHDCFVGYFDAEDSRRLEIPPGETRFFELPIEAGLAQPECFFDYRLSFPGIYRMRIILDPKPDARLFGVHALPGDYGKTQNRLLEQIFSNKVLLTVEEPQGEDLLVWNRMLERTKGKGWGGSDWLSYGFSMAKEIWEKHKGSRYTPYIVAGVPALSEERISNYELVLSMNPNHLMAPFLHRGLADIYAGLSSYELNVRKNQPEARKFFEKSQQHLKAVLENAENEVMRKEAQEKLAEKWEGRLKAYRVLEDREKN